VLVNNTPYAFEICGILFATKSATVVSDEQKKALLENKKCAELIKKEQFSFSEAVPEHFKTDMQRLNEALAKLSSLEDASAKIAELEDQLATALESNIKLSTQLAALKKN